MILSLASHTGLRFGYPPCPAGKRREIRCVGCIFSAESGIFGGMTWILVLLGGFLIFVGIADVFLTVLHYDGFGFLSSRLYRILFSSMRSLTRSMPPKARALGLSLVAPLMVPAIFTVWMILEITGFAFLYYAGMNEQTFNFSNPRLEPSFGVALYMSGTAIPTLGFGDVTPTSGVYQILAISESLVGFGILTLAVTYLIGVYGVLQQLGVLAAGLFHQASDTGDPLSILAPHFPAGEPRELETHVMALHRGLVEVYEGVRRYPIVYYYHSRRAYRSLPYTFRMMGGMAAALRWGLPAGHPGSLTPWLPTLITGLDTITAYLDERFLSEHLEGAPKLVPFETFEAVLTLGKEPSDRWLARFLEVEGAMRELARIEEALDPKEAYSRYTDWLPFAHRIRAFYEASAEDLGYELEDLTREPGKRLF